MKADSIHRRTHLPNSPGANGKQETKAGQQKGAPVEIRVGMAGPLDEAYNDFYPLHVTKVEDKKQSGSLALIIGVVMTIAILTLTFWYLKNQQVQEETSQSAVSSARAGEIDLGQPQGNQLNTTNPTISANQYINEQYGFAITKPASWIKVVEEVGDVNTLLEPKPTAVINFVHPTTDPLVSSGKVALVTLRIDAVDIYQALVAQNTETAPQKVGQSGQYVVSIHSRVNSSVPVDVKPAADALDAVLASFAVLTQ